MKIEIIPFDPKYSADFKNLNLDWLNRYFRVEPHDDEVLGDPEKHIIKPGGNIFFAREGKRILGTVALIKIEDNVFELTKMAVTPQAQGKKIGQKLMVHALEFAKEQGWKTLILYSNRKLENAIYIYKKYGFEEIPLEDNNPYARGDIKMKLELS
ncbi:MAG: GNAT family N-acetyltransferase [Gillisia sp.]|nr:GNAT family N-acetyltransferase [Gillisia sp.]